MIVFGFINDRTISQIANDASCSRLYLFFMLCYNKFKSSFHKIKPVVGANQRCSTCSKHICDAQGEWDPYAGFETGLCSLVYGTAEAVAAVESGTPAAAAASAANGPDAKKKD
jgi:hypothetical protein